MTTFADLRPWDGRLVVRRRVALVVMVHPSALPAVRDPWLVKWRSRRLAQHAAAVAAIHRVHGAAARRASALVDSGNTL